AEEIPQGVGGLARARGGRQRDGEQDQGDETGQRAGRPTGRAGHENPRYGRSPRARKRIRPAAGARRALGGTQATAVARSWRKRIAKSGSYSAAVATSATSAPSRRVSCARSTVVRPPTARTARSQQPALRQAS